MYTKKGVASIDEEAIAGEPKCRGDLLRKTEIWPKLKDVQSSVDTL